MYVSSRLLPDRGLRFRAVAVQKESSVAADGRGSVLQLIRDGEAHDPRRPRPHHRARALDRRPAGGRAARARTRVRGRRQRLDRRPAADACWPSISDAGVVLVADLGATHSRLAASDLAGAPLAERGVRHGHRGRPREGPRHGRRALHRAARRARPHAGGRPRHRHRRARPGRLQHGPAGQAADHAGLGRLPDPALVRRPLRRAGAGRQRRQHHGAAASTGRTGARPSTCCSSRSAPASAAESSPGARSTAARRAPPATSATSGSPATRT